MKVIIKKLTVKQSDSLIADITFNDFCTFLTCGKNDIVINIINLLVGSNEKKRCLSSVSFSAEVIIDDTYYIIGQKTKYATKWSVAVRKKDCEGDFTDEYFSLMKKSKEESTVTYFEDIEKQKYPLRLAFYKDNRYFYKGCFSGLTNGIGATRSFRVYLNEFIKNYKPELINRENDLWLSLKESGEFVALKGQNGKVISDLSKEDLLRYNLLCFINIVSFWDEFNKIRNINTIKTPVVIRLPDNCGFDLDCFIDKFNGMNRQVVVFE